MKTEQNPNTKSRHVQLTDKQWEKIYFVARLIEKKKNLPPYSLSRQVAFQVMVDALPDPPEGWTPQTHDHEIDFDSIQLNGFMTRQGTEPAAPAFIPTAPAYGGKKIKSGGKKIVIEP